MKQRFLQKISFVTFWNLFGFRTKAIALMIMLFSMICMSGYSQSRQVTGKVTDENNSGLPGVNVLLRGTSQGTITDIDGNYAISVPGPDAVLQYSFIGYTSEEVTVGTQSMIDISLAPDIRTLSEVVVVGYGVQRKSDVTGSLVTVNEQALKEVPVPNLQQALQGRAAGVEVQRIGTSPGATARIRVRGDRSILGQNDPLIVLDGIPYEGSLTDINQDDIASINILKDASATAIYGSRGANGVIIVSTKRGEPGKARLSIDSYYGVSTVSKKYDMYNAEEYAAMRDASAWPYGYMQEEIEGLATGRNTDWQDLMYEDGYITNHNLTVTGGSDEATYAIGGGFYQETTVLPEQDFTRYSVKGTVDTKVGRRLKLGVNSLNSLNITNGSQFVNEQPGTDGAFGGHIMYNILATSPLMPAYNENGEIFQKPFGNTDDAAGNYNPLLVKDNINEWVDRVRRLRTFNSLYAEYEILDGLSYRFNLGLDYNQQNFAQFQGADTYFRVASGNRARVRNAENFSWTAENLLNYNKTFAEKHRFSFTGLFSAQQNSYYYTQVHKDSIAANFIEHYHLGLSNPTPAAILDGDEETWGLLSYMGRINYSFDDRYLLTLTYRTDGASRLAKKWHSYPAVAVGWNLSNESFLKDKDIVSQMKLRVGYGQTSNQAVDPYTTRGGVTNANGDRPIKYNYGGTKVSGYIPNRIPDESLDWEYTNTFNVGLDFGLFEDRITGTVDYYNAQTRNLLYDFTLPITTGYEAPFQTNLGEMENKGIEVALSAAVLRTAGGFTWNIDANWFMNRNKLLALSSGEERNISNGLFIGNPMNAIYDFKKLGIWQESERDIAESFGQEPGQIKFADLSGPEGEPDGAITADDRTIIGSQQADWQGGLTNRFTFKGFDLSVVAYVRSGGLLMSYLHGPNGAYLTNLDGKRNGLDVDYWTPDNPTNWFPAPSAGLPSGASSGWSTLAYYDASFVKIRSINLGYNLPASLLNRVSMSSARIYFTAQNPFLLFSPYVSKYNGVDPEPTGEGDTGIIAVSDGVRTDGVNQHLVITASTPPTRSFLFGINVSF